MVVSALSSSCASRTGPGRPAAAGKKVRMAVTCSSVTPHSLNHASVVSNAFVGGALGAIDIASSALAMVFEAATALLLLLLAEVDERRVFWRLLAPPVCCSSLLSSASPLSSGEACTCKPCTW